MGGAEEDLAARVGAVDGIFGDLFGLAVGVVEGVLDTGITLGTVEGPKLESINGINTTSELGDGVITVGGDVSVRLIGT